MLQHSPSAETSVQVIGRHEHTLLIIIIISVGLEDVVVEALCLLCLVLLEILAARCGP